MDTAVNLIVLVVVALALVSGPALLARLLEKSFPTNRFAHLMLSAVTLIACVAVGWLLIGRSGAVLLFAAWFAGGVSGAFWRRRQPPLP